MKKNILLPLISLFFITAHTQAQEWYAQDYCYDANNYCDYEKNFYAKILAEANFLQDTRLNGNRSNYQAGYLFAGALGFDLHCGLRLEAEYAYRRNAIKRIHFFQQGSSGHGHFQTSSYMANLLWDVPLSSCGIQFGNIQPYIGVGLGYDFQQMHSSNSRIIFHQRWRHFAWQLMAGASYPIFGNTELLVEYRFHQGGSHFNNHAVGIGLTYKFNLRNAFGE